MVKALLEALVLLAKEGAHHPSGVMVSLNWLVDCLGTSRQTASRWLAELEGRGLIKREREARGQRIRLTQAGLQVLRSIYGDLRAVFEVRPRVFKLVGRVVSGLGEGSYYMGQRGYREQFKRVLGFEPYPGTLDVKLSGGSTGLRAELENLPGERIEGFTTAERTFGHVKCFSARLGRTRVAVVMPSRSSNVGIIELIAPKNLRRNLRLKDGDPVRVEVIT